MTEQKKKKIEETIGYKEYTVNSYDLANSVAIAKGQYINKHRSFPKYLKMPLWAYRLLISYDNPFISIDRENKTHFCGLIICETESIEKLEQIEVF